MSVDVRGSGGLSNDAKLRMRRDVYALTDRAFHAVGVGAPLMHREDRGDGFIAALDSRIPPARLLGSWLAEVHQGLRPLNDERSRRLALRVGMHVGPVEEDDNGLAGEAMDLVCRLADAQTTRAVLDHSGRDVVCVVSERLYRDVVRHGGRFVEPDAYRSASLTLKEGPVVAWFHVPGEPRPMVPGDEGFGEDGQDGQDGQGATRGHSAAGGGSVADRGAEPGDASGADPAARADGASGRARRREAASPEPEPEPEPEMGTGGGGSFDIDVKDGDAYLFTGSVVHGSAHFGGRGAHGGARGGDGASR
ncbi:hypothetical protein ACH47C_24665 [Streptomyces rishiriensis]|uniref:hypothetical protein n=1 Tax=Streptomyces rishiriensis TaxID=68264 RepID=UPI0033F028E2